MAPPAPKKMIEGLGAVNLIPKRLHMGETELAALGRLGNEAGFVLSRVDGVTTLGNICLLVPFPETQTHGLLKKLWEIGAIDLPGLRRTQGATMESPNASPPPTASASTSVAPGAPRPAPAAVVAVVRAEVKPLAPPPDAHLLALPAEQQLRIDTVLAGTEVWNAFELLELGVGADDREIKRAYFRLSKEFHPDRYFGKDIGAYRDRLTKIFQNLKASFELLSDAGRRQAYLESIGSRS